MKNESMVATKCPKVMFIASQVQTELNSRWSQWSKNENIQRSLGI